MSADNPGKAGWGFWAVGVVSLIWNALGSVNFFVQMNPAVVASYRESERAIIEGRPIWATVAFAVAVLGGTVGSLLLLFRKSFSLNLFILSLLGVIVTMIDAMSRGIEFGAGEIVGIIVLPVLVALFLIWYANRARRRGWIS